MPQDTDREVSPVGVRISWQALSLFGALVVAAVTGMVAIGSNSRQIEINTAIITELRLKVDKIDELGSPQLQEVKARLNRIDVLLNNLPVIDANLTGRMDVIQGDIRRLDDLAVKKNQEWPVEIQRVAKMEALLTELDMRVRNIRVDVKSHAEQDISDLRDQLKLLQTQLDAERAAHPLTPTLNR